MLARIHEEMLESVKHLDEQTQGLVLLAYVNYQLYGIEPSKDNVLVYSIFAAKKFDLDKVKKDIEASVSNGKSGGRPPKTLENLKKPKTNLKQPKVNLRETEQEQDNIIISKDIINNSKELLIKDNILDNNITEKINKLIQELKETANLIWIAYDKKDERLFARHIITAKEYGELAEKMGQSRVEFAKNIMRASVLVKYRKGACSGPKAIYQNYAEVFNKAAEKHQKSINQDGIF